MSFPKLQPAPKMSRSAAINQKCKDCIYDSKAGGSWREQVENCTTTSCALWQHRPVSIATITLQRKTRTVGIDTNSILANLEDEDENVVEETGAT